MIDDPGQIGPGLSLSDTTDAGVADVNTNFRTAVLQALRMEGIDIVALDPNQVDSLVNTLWQSRRLRDMFGLEEGQAPGFEDVTVTPAELRNTIRKELFDPAESTSSAALQTGISMRQLQGLPLTSAQERYAGSAGGRVPSPFNMSDVTGYGYGYGDPDPDFPSGVHEGIDYDMNEATPLYSPFSGVVTAEWSGGYGNLVTVHLDNGYEFRMGHLSGFAVASGQRVNPGDLLGLSGSTGNSSGPHVHVEWRDPGGQAVDPGTVLNPIFKGTSFRNLNVSPGVSEATTSALYSKYPEAVSAFERYKGRRPAAQELMPLIGMTPDQLAEYFRRQASHIPGLTYGAYGDLKKTADSVSQDLFGHGVTDGMVKELSDQGKTSEKAIKFWLEQMDIAGKMDPKQYQTLYRLNLPHYQAIYNQTGADPRALHHQFQQAQAQGITVPAYEVGGAVDTGPPDEPTRRTGRGF